MQTLKAKKGVQVKLTNKQFLEIFHTLQETRTARGVKYALIVISNSEAISAHLKELDEAAKPSEEFIELSVKARELIQEEKFEELEQLEQANKEVVEARKAAMDEINAKMLEEATLELKMIPEEFLPSDITAEQLEKLMPIIQ
jgi:hypothetical protein